MSALAWLRTRAGQQGFAAAWDQEARVFGPLLLRPALTLVALASIALRPTYPYAFTLPVALTQDWGMAQDLLALAAILALRLPAPRFPAPRAGEVFLLSFLAYARARARLGLALGLAPRQRAEDAAQGRRARPLADVRRRRRERPDGGTGDTAAHRDSFRRRPPRSAASREDARSRRRAARRAGTRSRPRASRARWSAASRAASTACSHPGPRCCSPRASGRSRGQPRARRDGARGRECPRLLLARRLAGDGAVPAGARRDRPGGPRRRARVRLRAGAALPLLLPSVLSRDAGGAGAGACLPARSHCGRSGPAASLAPRRAARRAALAAPEVPAGVGSAAGDGAPGRVAEPGRPSARPHAAGGGLPVSWCRTLASLYLFALYNFAITGSVRPDALFLAWGPGGVSSARMGQGCSACCSTRATGSCPTCRC